MRLLTIVPRLLASAVLLCASGAAVAEPVEDTLKQIQAQIDALGKKGQHTVNTGSLAIESWLLSTTAIDSTAGKIYDAVSPKLVVTLPDGKLGQKKVLVVTGPEVLDFGLAAMINAEMQALRNRLLAVCGGCVDRAIVELAIPLPALAGAVIGLLKSETDLTAIDLTVDAKLLAAAVAGNLGNAFLPSAAVAPSSGGKLITSFNLLVATAEDAQRAHDDLAKIEKPSDAQKEKLAKLKSVLARYDSFYAKVTTANANGIVPLSVAARLDDLMKDDPYVLRVNTEKAGGTLLKRTNVLTALGAESAFISGGLVSSYQLTDPKTGKLFKAGVITCRTTLTSLKRVQAASWISVDNSGVRHKAAAVCSP